MFAACQQTVGEANCLQDLWIWGLQGRKWCGCMWFCTFSVQILIITVYNTEMLQCWFLLIELNWPELEEWDGNMWLKHICAIYIYDNILCKTRHRHCIMPLDSNFCVLVFFLVNGTILDLCITCLAKHIILSFAIVMTFIISLLL